MNNTTTLANVSATCTSEELTDIYISGWIAGGLSICTAILNGFVIIMLLRLKKLSNSALMVSHLAATGLAVAILDSFPTMIKHHYSWEFGKELCKWHQYSDQTAMYASSYALIALSIDRNIAISKPLCLTRKKKWYKYMIVLIPWMLSTIFSIPYYVLGFLHPYCEASPGSSKVWCLANTAGIVGKIVLPCVTVFLIVIPAVIIISLNVYVYCFIKSKLDIGIKIRERRFSEALQTSSSASLTSAKKRSLLISIVVGIVFTVCWLPTTGSTYAIMISQNITLLNGIFHTLQVLYPLNSLINPIIIIVFNYNLFTCGRPQLGRMNSRLTDTIL